MLLLVLAANKHSFECDINYSLQESKEYTTSNLFSNLFSEQIRLISVKQLSRNQHYLRIFFQIHYIKQLLVFVLIKLCRNSGFLNLRYREITNQQKTSNVQVVFDEVEGEVLDFSTALF